MDSLTLTILSPFVLSVASEVPPFILNVAKRSPPVRHERSEAKSKDALSRREGEVEPERIRRSFIPHAPAPVSHRGARSPANGSLVLPGKGSRA